jgi:hypothetical protein
MAEVEESRVVTFDPAHFYFTRRLARNLAIYQVPWSWGGTVRHQHVGYDELTLAESRLPVIPSS